MSSDVRDSKSPPLDISRWSSVPVILIVVGAIFAGIGVVAGGKDVGRQFAYSWLLAFMFYLSLAVGGWFLVMVHHLFDASWSVPIRRVPEALACLLAPPLLVLFLPIAFLASRIYPWLQHDEQLHPDHALISKYPLFTTPGYYIAAAAMFAVWWLFSSRLRFWSLQQDATGSVECTRKMRFYSCLGIVCFALSVTLAAIMWMKGLMDEWYSTMYGVCYFAASVWTTLPTVYVIVLILQRKGDLKGLVGEKTYYFIGSLFFAFTVFWAYVNFAQYFIIWNANMPEETFWYNLRESGTWNYVGKYVIIFGHFFVPFLMLLRIDWKLKLTTMLPLAAWAWFMHFVDIEFQIMPALHPDNIFSWGLLSDIGCVLLFGGFLAKVFMASFNRYPAYPQKDPRMAEALDIYVPSSSHISTAPERAK
jgi:hypothetical protein